MAQPLAIRLNGRPPSWNSAYRSAGKIIYMTRPAKAWKEYVEEAVRWEIKGKKWSLSGDETQIVVNINTFLNRPMDADNILKLTLDACAKAMGINDVRFLPRVWKMERRHKVEYMTLEFVEENGND